jgi:hypothetical protein
VYEATITMQKHVQTEQKNFPCHVTGSHVCMDAMLLNELKLLRRASRTKWPVDVKALPSNSRFFALPPSMKRKKKPAKTRVMRIVVHVDISKGRTQLY